MRRVVITGVVFLKICYRIERELNILDAPLTMGGRKICYRIERKVAVDKNLYIILKDLKICYRIESTLCVTDYVFDQI